MYGYKKQVKFDYPEAVRRTRDELQKEGFGVLTEIDVKATLKQKLDVDYGEMYSSTWILTGFGMGGVSSAAIVVI